jgi:hypothetical protein
MKTMTTISSGTDVARAPGVTIRPARQAVPLWSTQAGSTAIFRIGTDPPDVVELWDWTLQPDESFEGGAHPRAPSRYSRCSPAS